MQREPDQLLHQLDQAPRRMVDHRPPASAVAPTGVAADTFAMQVLGLPAQAGGAQRAQPGKL